MQFHRPIFISTIRDAWPLGLLIVGVVIAIGLGATWRFLAGRNMTDAIRYTGMFLQLFGLFQIAFGLSNLRRLFGLESLSSALVNWLRKFRAAFSKPVIAEMRGTPSGGVRVGGHATVTFLRSPTTPLDVRVQMLETELAAVRTDVTTLRGESNQKHAETAAAIENEALQRRAESGDIRKKLQELAVGGLHLEAVGLIWLGLGVIATSAPEEVSYAVSWIIHS